MNNTAFDLIRGGILQSAQPASPYAEVGTATGGSGWLRFPAPLPSSTEHLWFFSYLSSQDSRKTLLGFENTNARQGISQDWNQTADGFQKPRLSVIINSGTRDYVMPKRALGDRLHLLISQKIVGTNAKIIAYLWDETRGAWNEAVNIRETDGTSKRFLYGKEDGTSLFAALGGQRKTNLISYRAAFWTAPNLTAGLPNITQPAVRDNFTSGLHLVDPAISHAAYGVPLYDIHGPASVYNSGTNLGSGGNFTANGSFTPVQ